MSRNHSKTRQGQTGSHNNEVGEEFPPYREMTNKTPKKEQDETATVFTPSKSNNINSEKRNPAVATPKPSVKSSNRKYGRKSIYSRSRLKAKENDQNLEDSFYESIGQFKDENA